MPPPTIIFDADLCCVKPGNIGNKNVPFDWKTTFLPSGDQVIC